MTPAELSSLTGIAQPNLSRIEGGRVDTRLSTLVRIAHALGMDLATVERPVITMEEVRSRMEKGRRRLAERGLHPRNVEGRLAWKRARGD